MILSLAAWGLACAQTPSPGQLTQAETDRLVQSKLAEDPILKTQTDVGLDAVLGRPGMVQVTLVNKTREPLVVGPKMFAVIGPDRKPVAAAPQSLKTFPVTRLGSGEQASGELIFPAARAVRGAKLVFDPHRPDCRPAMALIFSFRWIQLSS